MKKSPVLLVLALVFSACSLRYDEEVNVEASNPEFVFTQARVTRYRGAKKTAEAQAQSIEQYKNSSGSYVKAAEFKTYDSDAELQAEGACGFLYADSEEGIYELYDDIEIFSRTQNARFFADALHWDSRTEQLTGSRTDTVRIEKDGTVIYGSGFSASGVSSSFTFSGAVSGVLETDSPEPEADADAAEN